MLDEFVGMFVLKLNIRKSVVKLSPNASKLFRSQAFSKFIDDPKDKKLIKYLEKNSNWELLNWLRINSINENQLNELM